MKKKEVYIILFLSILLGLLTSCSNAMSLTTTAEYSTIALINTAAEEKEQEETSAPQTLTESESHQSEKVPGTIEPTSSMETEEMRTILETYQNYVDEYAPVESGYTYELIYIDEDDIPELLVQESDDIDLSEYLLITYYNGRIYEAGIDRLYGCGFQYVEKANFYKEQQWPYGLLL